MDFLIDFAGIIVHYLCSWAGSMMLGIFACAFIASLLTFGVSQKSYENIVLSSLMWEDLQKIKKTHSEEYKDAKNDLQKLFTKYHYNLGQSTICTIAQAILGLVVGFGFMSSRMDDLVAKGSTFFDYVSVPFFERTSQDTSVVVAFFVVLIAVAVQSMHDIIYEQEVITDQKIVDLIILILIIGACLFLPMAFSMYWIFHEIIDIGIMFYVTRAKRKTIVDEVTARVKSEEEAAKPIKQLHKKK